MYLDVEGIVTLNAQRRADMYQEVVGPYRARHPWTDRIGGRPVALWRPLQALQRAVVHRPLSAAVEQPSI